MSRVQGACYGTDPERWGCCLGQDKAVSSDTERPSPCVSSFIKHPASSLRGPLGLHVLSQAAERAWSAEILVPVGGPGSTDRLAQGSEGKPIGRAWRRRLESHKEKGSNRWREMASEGRWIWKTIPFAMC